MCGAEKAKGSGRHWAERSCTEQNKDPTVGLTPGGLGLQVRVGPSEPQGSSSRGGSAATNTALMLHKPK